MPAVDTDVLVVGAGPTGATASALLATYGVDAVTITKHPGPAPTPRAHITNQRTMEVFRDLGLEAEMRRIATPLQEAGNNVWAVSFSGTELARLPAWGTGADRRSEYLATSPSEMCNIPQHRLEPVLLRGALGHGADIRFSTELDGIEQHPDHVAARLRDRATGERSTIRARYLVGADGARSTVAERAGFHFEGENGVLNWAVSAWLQADLTRYCAYRPGVLYWMHHPGDRFFSSTWISVRPWTEWVMTVVYPPSAERAEVHESEVLDHARRMVDDPSVEVRLKSVNSWTLGRAVATEYRRGRVFLAGDSAHRHPPPNGLGSNTGVQDAYNLCWKLAAVLAGRAGDALLDTYEAERQPVGREVVDRVMRSLGNMEPLIRAFGLGEDLGERREWDRVNALSEDSDDGRARRRDLREALRLQHFQFNCHGVECGQRYVSSAVIDGGAESPPRDLADAQLYYRPTTKPGACLPHAWIERRRTPMSTVDLAGHGRFTLITGIGGADWVRAAERVSESLGVTIDPVVLDYRQTHHDAYGDWARLREVNEDGCLLVRPDRHVAWRAHDRSAASVTQLTDAMCRILSRTPEPAGHPRTTATRLYEGSSGDRDTFHTQPR